MNKKALKKTTRKTFGYVHSLGLVHEKLCEKLTCYLEEVTRKGGRPAKGYRLPEPSRVDRSMEFQR